MLDLEELLSQVSDPVRPLNNEDENDGVDLVAAVHADQDHQQVRGRLRARDHEEPPLDLREQAFHHAQLLLRDPLEHLQLLRIALVDVQHPTTRVCQLVANTEVFRASFLQSAN